MNDQLLSPRIANFSWGRLELDSGDVFKDAKLFPGGARAWDWNETGTRHSPGIQVADAEELIERGATAIVLTRGVNGRLEVSPATVQTLTNRGIAVHVLQTEEAVRVYNELAEKEPVGGLFHSTC